MKFSVLISVYAKENPQFLKESLDSIINQTVAPNEIVLVKDGPITKELDQAIDTYVQKYPNLFVIVPLKKNSGLGIALNVGIKNCKYDLIARMDSDDIAINTRFEKQLNEFRKNPRLSMVGTTIKEFDKTIGDSNTIRLVPECDKEIKVGLKKRNCFNHMTVMFRKKDIIDVDGYLDCPYFEDYYLWCRMAVNNSEFHNIQEVLVNARTGNSMLKRRGGLKYCKHIYNFYDKIYKIKFINRREFLINVSVRMIVSICPTFIRKLIYSIFLRKRG